MEVELGVIKKKHYAHETYLEEQQKARPHYCLVDQYLSSYVSSSDQCEREMTKTLLINKNDVYF